MNVERKVYSCLELTGQLSHFEFVIKLNSGEGHPHECSKMKLEVSDTHSDYSNDSQTSQDSSTSEFHTNSSSRPSLLFVSLEGLNSGVPTRTTATITPTQLRSFEQTYIELTSCRADQNNHAGFVPPSVTQANNYGMLNPMGYPEMGPTTALHVSPGPLSASGDSSSSPGLPAPKRRNMGGRRPKMPQDISPEEEERRKIRRERNKMAAARCRKRRLDHTNELQEETDKLEAKRQDLQAEIKKLNYEKEHLTVVLNNHLATCRLPSVDKRSVSPQDVKPFQEPYPYTDIRVKNEVLDPDETVMGIEGDIFTSPAENKRIMFSAANVSVLPIAASLDTPPVTRINRPNFLDVPLSHNPAQVHNSKVSGNNSKVAGIEISTPSNGIPFNFDSLMEGGTGLTPVHPHPNPCATQLHRIAPEAITPDNNPNLVSL